MVEVLIVVGVLTLVLAGLLYAKARQDERRPVAANRSAAGAANVDWSSPDAVRIDPQPFPTGPSEPSRPVTVWTITQGVFWGLWMFTISVAVLALLWAVFVFWALGGDNP